MARKIVSLLLLFCVCTLPLGCAGKKGGGGGGGGPKGGGPGCGPKGGGPPPEGGPGKGNPPGAHNANPPPDKLDAPGLGQQIQDNLDGRNNPLRSFDELANRAIDDDPNNAEVEIIDQTEEGLEGEQAPLIAGEGEQEFFEQGAINENEIPTDPSVPRLAEESTHGFDD